MELISTLLFVIIAAVGILLAIWVYYSDKKSPISWWFAVVTFTILLWNTFGFFAYRATGEAQGLLFFRLNFSAVSLFFIAVYFFSIYFPVVNTKRNRWLDWIVVIATSLFAILSLFSSTIINQVRINLNTGSLVMETGEFGAWFYIYCVVLMLYILFLIVSKYFSIDRHYRARMQYFIIGILAFAALNIIFSIFISYLVPNNYKITQLGDYSSIVFLMFTAYAIVKHQLFNIKVFATQTIVVVLSLALLIEIFVSNNLLDGVIKAIIWVLATYSGWLLVKSVQREIKQREKIEELAVDLKKANEHLKELDVEKDNFLSMASHELNSPLAAIKGYLSMMLEEGIGGKLNKKQTEFLSMVFTSAKRLAHLVKDLLNVSRIEQGRIHLTLDEADINDIINQAVAEITPNIKEANHKLVVSLDEDLPHTWCDVDRINEVVVNLLSNAVKYTNPGGRIEISSQKAMDNILVTIKDNGLGIPKSAQGKIFGKFEQGNMNRDQRKGTGLGLYIVKNLIELHKGRIWVESDEGKGSTFFFTLPIYAKKPEDPHAGEGAVLRLNK